MIRSSFFEKGVVSGGCFGKKLHRIDPSDQPLIYNNRGWYSKLLNAVQFQFFKPSQNFQNKRLLQKSITTTAFPCSANFVRRLFASFYVTRITRATSFAGRHIEPVRRFSMCECVPPQLQTVSQLKDVLPELPSQDTNVQWILDWSSKPLNQPPEWVVFTQVARGHVAVTRQTRNQGG